MSEIVNDADEIVRRYKVTIDYITKEYDQKLKEQHEEILKLKENLLSFTDIYTSDDWKHLKEVYEAMTIEQREVLYTLIAQAVKNDRLSIIKSLEVTIEKEKKDEKVEG